MLHIEKLIREFCQSYQKIALINFMHDITFGKGQISMLVCNNEIQHFYNKNKIPMLCTDESGRTLSAGIYINKILEKEYPDCAILMPYLVKIGKRFGQNFGKNSLHIVTRENNLQHLYSLFFDLNEKDFLHWIINNGKLLDDLIQQYNLFANAFIQEAMLDENRITLPSFNSKSILKNHPMSLLHKTLQLPIYLSQQQNQCLKLLMQGKSAKEIASKMQISRRTVEHYLERIKKMLGCNTSKELIIHYYDQYASCLLLNEEDVK